MANENRVTQAFAYVVQDGWPRVTQAFAYSVHGPNERRVTTVFAYAVDLDAAAAGPTEVAPVITLEAISPTSVLVTLVTEGMPGGLPADRHYLYRALSPTNLTSPANCIGYWDTSGDDSFVPGYMDEDGNFYADP